MHRHLLPLLLLAAAPGAPEARDGAVSLAPDSESRWIPFELTPGNQIAFTLELDGRPVMAILDTGVSYSVLARRFAEANALPVRAGGNATVIGGTVPIGTVHTRGLSFAGLVRAGGQLTVAALPATATGSTRAADMLVGRDLVGGFALDIDYAERRFRLLPSRRLPFAGAIAPLRIARETRVYVTEARIGAVSLAPMIVDTGDGSGITVSQRAWRAAGPPALSTTTAVSFGLAGPVVSELAIMPELRIGALVARRIELRVERPGGFSDSVGVAGRIGTGFLRHYRVLLDARAGRIVLSPGPGADQAPIRSTSGLLVGLADDRLRVLHVMRGSPAATGGWRDGELICQIDGHPIGPDYAGSDLAVWSADTPGRVVELGLCDGETRALTLKQFY